MINIKGDVENWKCVYKECKAKCCKPAKVTIGDLKRISSKTGFPPKNFAETEDEQGLFQLKSKDGLCCFLNEDYSCQLHRIGKDIVPLSCRMFPFLFDGINYSDDIILTIKTAEDCPGNGRGEQLSEDFKAEIETLGSQFVHEIEQYIRLKQRGNSFIEIFENI